MQDTCSSCHGEGVTASGVQSRVQATLDELQDFQEAMILTLLAEQIANLPRGQAKKGADANGKGRKHGNSIDLAGRATITDIDQIADIVFGETRGRQAIAVTLADGTETGLLRVTDIDVIDHRGRVIGTLYDFADDRLIKAGWNWNLVNNDRSRGIHNPTFSLAALNAGIDALFEVALE